jgi:hypothetical protein
MQTKQKNLTDSNPKLFRVFNGDGNDRQETYRFKAFDINDVVEYIKKEFFVPDFDRSNLEIDWQGEDMVYIMWNEGGDCESCCDNGDDCEFDYCDENITQNYFEVFLEENAEPLEFSFNTIEGTNNFVDLTQPKPKQAEDWKPELAQAWRNNPQEGANKLLELTLKGELKE